MSVGFENMNKLIKKTDTIEKLAEEKIAMLLQSIGQTVRGNAVKLIQTQTAGQPYTRYKNGSKRTGIASSAGNPPNTDTGNLVKDIQVRTVNKKEVTVGTSAQGAPYGKFLEYGTSRMAERPWLEPAYKLSEKIIEDKAQKLGLEIIKKVKI